MKQLVLVSGGDAPGINAFLAKFNKLNKNVDAVIGGFRGLIDGNIKPLASFMPEEYKKQAGCIIKSSRCPEFKEDINFNIALNIAKKYDVVIILGGNGSFKGASRLADNGVRTIFIPTTIDNDVDNSEYSLGFDSAVQACKFVVNNVMPSMEAFNRCCVFEVMGRKCDAISKAVYSNVKADYLIANEKDLKYRNISKIVKEKFNNGEGSCIILRENIIDISEFCDKLQNSSKVVVKNNIIGHIQRGFKPTDCDIKAGEEFAKQATKALKKLESSCAIVYKNQKIQLEKIDK